MIPRTLIIVVTVGILTTAAGLGLILYRSTAWEEYKKTQEFQDKFGGREPDKTRPISQSTWDWIYAMRNETVYPYSNIGHFVASGGIVFTFSALASYLIAKEVKRQ